MLQTILSIVAVIAFVIVVFEVWRSPASTGKKVVWTVLAFFFSIITAIVWFVWGRQNAGAGKSVV